MSEEIHVGKLPIPTPTGEEEEEECYSKEKCENIPEHEIESFDIEPDDYNDSYSAKNNGGIDLGNRIDESFALETRVSTDAVERRQLLRKIFRYRTMFKEETADLPISQAPDLNMTQLRSLSDDVEFMVACRRSATQSRRVFITGVSVAEAIAQPIGFKIKGLTQVMQAEEDIMKTVDEISIKYESDMMVAPEIRLGMTLAHLCLTLHKLNSAAEETMQSGEISQESIQQEKQQTDKEKKETNLMEGL